MQKYSRQKKIPLKYDYKTDDITFCMRGLDDCLVTRCERHPRNIIHQELPHSYAQLYQTEYCPLNTPKVKEMDVVEVVRCKDCVNYDGRPCGLVGWWNTENDYCSRGEQKDG